MLQLVAIVPTMPAKLVAFHLNQPARAVLTPRVYPLNRTRLQLSLNRIRRNRSARRLSSSIVNASSIMLPPRVVV